MSCMAPQPVSAILPSLCHLGHSNTVSFPGPQDLPLPASCVCVCVCARYGNMEITFTALDTTWTRPCPSASMYKPVWPARPNFSLRLIVTEVGSSTETVWIEGIHWCMHTCVHVKGIWMSGSPSNNTAYYY